MVFYTSSTLFYRFRFNSFSFSIFKLLFFFLLQRLFSCIFLMLTYLKITILFLRTNHSSFLILVILAWNIFWILFIHIGALIFHVFSFVFLQTIIFKSSFTCTYKSMKFKFLKISECSNLCNKNRINISSYVQNKQF